eukprot:EC723513.1.p1 GENE.EC723513.1~~EC723513.1.p1  ORF type:complete len:131 (+),score=6.70 EC723513.1:138-530(+)
MQACHGKEAPLKRTKPGDWIVYYSPSTEMGGGKPCQAFSTLGQISSDEVTQVTMAPGFKPFRKEVQYVDAKLAPIRPLIASLSFIKNKEKWGAAFRYGLFEIPESDFQQIATAMGVVLQTALPISKTSLS